MPSVLIDRDFLLAQAGGDRRLAAELLGLFVEHLRAKASGLDELSPPERRPVAHSVRSVAVNVGARDLARAAGAVEDDPSDGDLVARLSLLAARAARDAGRLADELSARGPAIDPDAAKG